MKPLLAVVIIGAMLVLVASISWQGGVVTPSPAHADSGFCGVRVSEGESDTWYFYTWRNKCKIAHTFRAVTNYGRAATPCYNTLAGGTRTGTSKVYPAYYGGWHVANC